MNMEPAMDFPFAPTDLQPSTIGLFGDGARFHHIGIVVPDIGAVCPAANAATDPVQDVTVAFAEFHGTMIEFIQPVSDESPVRGNLKKGIKLAHLCFSVPDMNSAIAAATDRDLRLIAEPVPAVAFSGRKIAWMFHPVLGLFELVEAPVTASESTAATPDKGA
jgi:methylmalonyl-CoA/ethylmalonyl-CoA epimerase